MLLMIYICCIKYETKGGKASSLSERMSLAHGTASSHCLGVAKRGGNATWTGWDVITRAGHPKCWKYVGYYWIG